MVFGVLEGTASYQVLEIVERLLVQSRGRQLPGIAPPGWFEDTLQQWLEEVKEEGSGS